MKKIVLILGVFSSLSAFADTWTCGAYCYNTYTHKVSWAPTATGDTPADAFHATARECVDGPLVTAVSADGSITYATLATACVKN